MATVEDAIRTLTEYYAAFGTLDIGTILPYFNEPSVFIGPSGVFPMATSAAISTVLGRAIQDLRSKDYARSEFVLEDTKALGAAVVLASGVAIRYKTSGDELERLGISYLIHNTDNRWKIAVMIIHGPA